jgi:hypothetical protein
MIIARGHGWSTAGIIFVSIASVSLLVKVTAWPIPEWVTYFAMALPAAALNAIFVVPAAEADRRMVRDSETFQEIEVKGTHTLFWIPIWYWTFIIPIYPVIGTWQEWSK